VILYIFCRGKDVSERDGSHSVFIALSFDISSKNNGCSIVSGDRPTDKYNTLISFPEGSFLISILFPISKFLSSAFQTQIGRAHV
jgi:hypothetical protein